MLQKEGLSASVGDEGGFTPSLGEDKEAFQWILAAIKTAGYEAGKDVFLAIDGACSEWQEKSAAYTLPKKQQNLSTDELIDYWTDACQRIPLLSLEDPLGDEDRNGWIKITEALGKNHLLVGDDLFVTNPTRLQSGISQKLANAILIKPNQIGTLTETLETVTLAKKHGYNVILSHRSGESEDTSISDIAVAVGAGYIKSGAPARSERVAKYNRLLRIEEGVLTQRPF